MGPMQTRMNHKDAQKQMSSIGFLNYEHYEIKHEFQNKTGNVKR